MNQTTLYSIQNLLKRYKYLPLHLSRENSPTIEGKINLEVKNDELDVEVGRLTKPPWEELKPFLYDILNTFHKSHLVTIKNIPYCLMPDAEDHIIYNKIGGLSYYKTSKCKSCKYYSLCPGYIKDNGISEVSLDPVSDLPREIVIEVDKRCNQGCVFCFSHSQNSPVSSSQIKKIIDEAKKLKIKYIRFTGGEPLLRNDILELIRHAKSLNFYVFLNTNGTLFDESFIRKIENFVDNVLISLQGYNARIENEITQRGDLVKKRYKNILRIKRANIPYFRIGTVASKFLLNNLDKYYLLIRRLGIKVWEIYRPMISKSLAQQYPQFNLSVDEFVRIIKFIYGLKKRGISASIGNATPFCISSLSKSTLLGTRFDDGHYRLIYDARGFFKPSYNIDINLGSTIQEAWMHPFMRKVRALRDIPQSCQECLYLKWCLGGSRYQAREYYGDYFMPDPWMKNNQ